MGKGLPLGVTFLVAIKALENEQKLENTNYYLRILLRLEYKSHCIRRHARLFIRNLFVLQDMSYNFIKDQVGIQNTPTLY